MLADFKYPWRVEDFDFLCRFIGGLKATIPKLLGCYQHHRDSMKILRPQGTNMSCSNSPTKASVAKSYSSLIQLRSFLRGGSRGSPEYASKPAEQQAKKAGSLEDLISQSDASSTLRALRTQGWVRSRKLFQDHYHNQLNSATSCCLKKSRPRSGRANSLYFPDRIRVQ